MWKKILFGICLTMIVVMSIAGKNPTVRFCATTIKQMAKYIEDITSDDKMEFQNYGRISHVKELTADKKTSAPGSRVQRRRNPAQTRWEETEQEET
jgi:hypothetical protein